MRIVLLIILLSLCHSCAKDEKTEIFALKGCTKLYTKAKGYSENEKCEYYVISNPPSNQDSLLFLIISKGFCNDSTFTEEYDYHVRVFFKESDQTLRTFKDIPGSFSGDYIEGHWEDHLVEISRRKGNSYYKINFDTNPSRIIRVDCLDCLIQKK